MAIKNFISAHFSSIFSHFSHQQPNILRFLLVPSLCTFERMFANPRQHENMHFAVCCDIFDNFSVKLIYLLYIHVRLCERLLVTCLACQSFFFHLFKLNVNKAKFTHKAKDSIIPQLTKTVKLIANIVNKTIQLSS